MTTWFERIEELRKSWERHASGFPAQTPRVDQRPVTWRAVADIPPGTQDVVVVDDRAPDLARLADLPTIEALSLIGEADDGVLRIVGKLGSLRSLYLHKKKNADLTPLGALTHLEHLTLSGPDITTLAPIARLRRLETLALTDLSKLTNIDEIAPLDGLRWLMIGGGMWSNHHLETLKPLTSLTKLECFLLISTRIRDESLEPLTHLSQLRYLGLPNYFTINEFAALAAALPSTVGHHRSPWFREPPPAGQVGYAVCRKCGEYAPGMTIGKPRKMLCPKCDAERIARHIARCNALVSAERDRRRTSEAST